MQIREFDAPHGKLVDVAADPLGWLVVYHDGATGDLVLHQLAFDGADRVPIVRLPCGAGNAYPRVYVWGDATYLAWRDGVDNGRLLNITTGLSTDLGLVHGNDPIAFGSWFCAYQENATFSIALRALSAPAEPVRFGQVGRGTGLSFVETSGHVVLVDDVRTVVAGLVNPRWAGACVVGENATGENRNIARLNDGREANLWVGLESFTPRIAERAA